jgi:hypothetical protein
MQLEGGFGGINGEVNDSSNYMPVQSNTTSQDNFNGSGKTYLAHHREATYKRLIGFTFSG